MCGIGGFYNCTGGRTPVKALKSLWRGLEGRGTHAAGFALQWTGADAPMVCKQPGPAHRLFKRLSKFIGKGDTTQYVMLHTRYSTQGSVKNNDNNHPVVTNGMIVTHNGVLHNDWDILLQLGLWPETQVDTEAINAGLSHRSPGWVLDEIDGSMSVAWVDSTSPDIVNLMTNGDNPLVIARTKSGDVVWASTKSILDASRFKITSFFHATPFKVYSISPDGIIRSQVVSDQRATANKGVIIHAASRPSNQWKTTRKGVTTSTPVKTSQNASNGSKKATNNIAPMRSSERTRPGGYPEDDLLAVGLEDMDWDAYFEAEGFVKVWRDNGWVYVPIEEVTL